MLCITHRQFIQIAIFLERSNIWQLGVERRSKMRERIAQCARALKGCDVRGREPPNSCGFLDEVVSHGALQTISTRSVEHCGKCSLHIGEAHQHGSEKLTVYETVARLLELPLSEPATGK